MDTMTALMSELERLPSHQVFGKVAAIQGLLVEVSGLAHLSVGDRCNVVARDGREVVCEVVGFRDARALVMPFGPLEGLGLGGRLVPAQASGSDEQVGHLLRVQEWHDLFVGRRAKTIEDGDDVMDYRARHTPSHHPNTEMQSS